MDKTTLVKNDFEIEGRVDAALRQAGLPVTLVDWNYDSEIEDWRLIVATPVYDTKGPLEANKRVIQALQNAGIYQEVPILRITVLSPTDNLAKALEKEVKLRTEGTIHIVALDRKKEIFTVIFTPYTGLGKNPAPMKLVNGVEELRRFLQQRLQIERTEVEKALSDIARRGRASVLNVQLTQKEAKRLGLA